MSEEDWLTAALTEPSLVANLLLQISLSHPHNKKSLFQKSHKKALNQKSHKKALSISSETPPLSWRVKQPRSKATPKIDSPNTPLSLCDRATSASEDATSSLAVIKSTKRSNKGLDASVNTKSKRSRKKKTLSELKEDEVLVLKERRDLEKKLASLHVTFEQERARNDRLKRLKLEYVSRAAKRVNLPVPAEESAIMVLSYNPFSAVSSICASKSVEQSLSNPPKPNRENQFMLPDLNLSIEDHTS